MGKNGPRCGVPCDTLVCGKNRKRTAMRDFGALRRRRDVRTSTRKLRSESFGPIFSFPILLGKTRTVVRIPMAWYRARSGSPRKSIREGATSVLGRGPESPENISCKSGMSNPSHKSSRAVFRPHSLWISEPARIAKSGSD